MELDMRDLQASELSFVYGAGGSGKCGCGGGKGGSKGGSNTHSTKKHSTKKCGSTKKHSTRGGSRCG
jgi:hypothetical protein